MKLHHVFLALALGASTCLLTAQDSGQRPEGQRPAGREGGPGGPPAGFRLLPPRALEQLNLTAAQKKQLEALETEVKAKLEKILTADQMEQLKQMRPPGGPGMRGQGRGPGGPGGDQGGAGEQRPPQRPAQE